MFIMSRQKVKPYGDTSKLAYIFLPPDVMKKLSDYCYSTGITKTQLLTSLVLKFLQESDLEENG